MASDYAITDLYSGQEVNLPNAIRPRHASIETPRTLSYGIILGFLHPSHPASSDHHFAHPFHEP
ncbi:hypothetical protein [Rhizobium leguminosarum]|uniref:hypothetical protein n=1 Tax=Rhizobium leguminosarum TaxID=384 RepID=UPI001C98790E|nr:hypothetical protein [Rhizobium leguminosarum]